ncbi:MAG: hypothetical protein AB1Z98_19800 [Nannocystaceae bacterium]
MHLVRCRIHRDARRARHGRLGRLSSLLAAPVLLVAGHAAADPVIDMEVGGEHNCTVNACGSVQCWGNVNQFYGEDMDLGSDYDDVAVGVDHTCALAFDDDGNPDLGGDVVCWGRSPADGDPEDWDLLAAPSDKFTQIDGGSFLTCGLKTNDQVDCWGWDKHGAASQEPSNFYAQVSAGYDYACGVTSGRNGIFCWGDVPAGVQELLIWDVPGRFVGEKWDKVSAGTGHVCATTTASNLAGGLVHRLYCWGNNSAEQVNPVQPQDESFTIAEPLETTGEQSVTIYRHPGLGYLDVAAAGTGTCAVVFGSSGNEISCWGYPFTPYGLGLTTWGNPSHEPPLPAGFDPDRVFLAQHNLCAIDDDAQAVECWSTDYINPMGEVDPDVEMCI